MKNKFLLIALGCMTASTLIASCSNKSPDSIANINQNLNDTPVSIPKSVVLTNFIKTIDVTSSNINKYSFTLSTICGGGSDSANLITGNQFANIDPANQIISSGGIASSSKIIKTISGLSCEIVVKDFTITPDNSNASVKYAPPTGTNMLTLNVDKNGNIVPSPITNTYPDAVEYDPQSIGDGQPATPLFLNGASFTANNANNTTSLVLGVSDKQETFNANNFKFDNFNLTYTANSELKNNGILDNTAYYKDKINSDTSMGFALPLDTDAKKQSVYFGGTNIGNAFTAQVMDSQGKPYTITLQGNSLPANCPAYAPKEWSLSSAVAIGCGPEKSDQFGYGNRSQGFKITFNPADNPNLPSGVYTGHVLMQGIDYNSPTIVQNIAVNLNITTTAPLVSKSSYAYVTNYNKNTVSVCQIETNGTLSQCVDSNAPTKLLNFPNGVTTNNGYAYIVNSNWANSSVTVCKIETNGTLSQCVDSGAGDVFKAVLGGMTIHNGYAYATGINTVTVCKIDSKVGTLSNCATTGPGFSGPHGITTNNDGYAYITNMFTNTVAVCKINSEDGTFSNCTASGAAAGMFNNPIEVTTDNGYAYVLNSSYSQSSVTVCKINSVDGTFSKCTPSGAEVLISNGGPQGIITNNSYAYITTPFTNSVIMCKIDPTIGTFSQCSDSGVNASFTQPYGITAFQM
jgi:6-phosphogluconolactonase (cycloisomerase 2 family)